MYGPRDNLFMPNMLEVAGQGMLRIFGNGHNRICFSHVDNYAHGLILGAPALYEGSPALGQSLRTRKQRSLGTGSGQPCPWCLDGFSSDDDRISAWIHRVFWILAPTALQESSTS